jgi:hypothetical protein
MGGKTLVVSTTCTQDMEMYEKWGIERFIPVLGGSG